MKKSIAMAGVLVLLSSLLARGADKPNIVFIYADDLGYGDVSIYNPNSQIPTPNIDRLAKEGLRFTDAHSPHATCTGSRYGLLTGTSSARSGVNNQMLRYGPAIDPDEMTLADFLRAEGYTTKMVGKWHLGHVSRDTTSRDVFLGTPRDSGFDYSNVLEGASDLEKIHARNRLLCDDAVRLIAEYGSSNQEQKLFLYYAPHEPHNPAVPGKQFVGMSKAGPYGDYVVQLDHWVGRISQALEDSQLAENTLLIFASDNGAQTKFTVDYPAHSPNGVLSGGKAKPEEGGHRTPFIARWPGVIPASTVSHALINQTDFFATLADYFNVELASQYPGSAKDSYSFLPVLTNPTLDHSRPPMTVVGSYRKGPWKIIGRTELYNLERDLSEMNNVLEEYPEIGKKLFEEYSAFIASRELKPASVKVTEAKRRKSSQRREKSRKKK